MIGETTEQRIQHRIQHRHRHLQRQRVRPRTTTRWETMTETQMERIRGGRRITKKPFNSLEHPLKTMIVE